MAKNIVRVNKTKNYTVMSNQHLNDENLSWKAKGIHSYILSRPDDWKVYISQLSNVSTDGRDATRSGVQELYDNYYWQKYPVYVNGKIEQWVTEVYETPFNPNEKIKNISYKGKIKTITYENLSVDKSKINNNEELDELLTGNPRLVENTNDELLTENPEIDRNKVTTNDELLTENPRLVGNTNNELLTENLKVGIPKLLNTEFNNHLYKQNTQSVIHENNDNNHNTKYVDKITKETLLEVNKKEDEELNNLVEDLKKIYKQANINEESLGTYYLPIKTALNFLYYQKDSIYINGTMIPAAQIKNDLQDLELPHVRHAISIFLNQVGHQHIYNPTKYLAICLYNAMSDETLRCVQKFVQS